MTSVAYEPSAAINPSELSESAVNPVTCPGCDGIDTRDKGPCRRPMFLDTLSPEERRLTEGLVTARLRVCDRCGLGFRQPIPNDAELRELYARMPVKRWSSEPTNNVGWTLAREWLRRSWKEERAPAVLDVGAFEGGWLKTLPAGWRKAAIEPSETGRTALKSAGIECVADFLRAPADEQRGRFDLVTMFDVFEHLPRPTQALAEAADYLRPGGWLMLSTGNCEHWSWRHIGGDHWYCEPIQHVRFGGPRYFHWVSAKMGVRLVTCRAHAHQRLPWRDRLTQGLETIVFGARRRVSWWTLAVKGLLHLPGWSYLRHKTSGPYAPGLQDHLFVVCEKSR